MKILVTGGTGVIGAAAVSELLARGLQVRLLSRHADEDAKQWEGVEPHTGDIADARSLEGSAEGCDGILHIAGIGEEEPPELTFEKVNVGGTGNMVAEAVRAGAKRFVFVSSLGADRGASDYHKSKLAAEQIVERSPLDWTIIRPGNVYGPGDEVISMILKMVRSLPVVPVIDNGKQEFQPVWHEDLAKALASTLEKPECRRQTLDVAGPEVTSMNDLIERFREITDRKALRVPVPSALAGFAIDTNKLTMLHEKNVIESRTANALMTLGVQPTPLDKGLRLLADSLPEVLPEDGFGKMQHKEFWADISGTPMTPARMMGYFREHLNAIMPIEFSTEPGTPQRVEPGATLTAALPLRGNIQIRVEVVEPARVVFGTIEGHPLAGIVQFTTTEQDNGVIRFKIDVYARSANFIDWFGMKTIGRPAQDANWVLVIQRMIEASGGMSDGVHSEATTLDEEEAARAEKSIKRMVQERAKGEQRSKSEQRAASSELESAKNPA